MNSAQATSAVEGKATVVPPINGAAWATFKLAVCEKDDNTTCLAGSPFDCPKAPPANDMTVATECTFGGAKASTTYTVVATAYEEDGTTSRASAASEFTTPAHP